MDESLIDKLKKVIEQHNQQTKERLEYLSVKWYVEIGGKGIVEHIQITVEK